MNLLTIWQHKFAVMVAVLALLAVLAIGVLAKLQCAQYDDYGNCILWEVVDERPGGSGLTDLLGD